MSSSDPGLTRRAGPADPPQFTYPAAPLRVRFLSRPNRYRAIVRPRGGGPSFAAHVPNPGRMEELLIGGETEGYAVPVNAAGRATAYDLVSVRHGRVLVSIDPRLSNRLAAQALEGGFLSGKPHGPWRPEVAYGASRIDFARVGADGQTTGLVEVKSSNLRVGRTALFPDAPTERGTRHLRALTFARRRGIFAGVLFLIQRPDVASFGPNAQLDPVFARALEAAARAGVRLWAVRLRVRPDGADWLGEVPVRFSGGEERL